MNLLLKIIKITLFLVILFTIHIIPQEVSEKFAVAQEEYSKGRYEKACKLFSELSNALQIDDEIYASSKYYAAMSLLKLNRKALATAELENIYNNIEFSNFRIEALYELGLIYFESKDYQKSRLRFKSLLNEDRNGKYSGSAMYWIGESYSSENKLDDAIEFLNQAIQDSKTNRFRDYTIYTLANVYEKKRDYENAVKYYDQLLSYYPNSPLVVSAQTRIGICYFYLKDYQSSILELKNPLLNNLPGSLYSETLYLLANSYYRVKEYSNAEEIYLEILEKFPDTNVLQDVKYGLAWTYFQQKRYKDAYIVFDDLSTGSDSIAIESYYWKAEAKRYAGQNNDAIKIFQSLLSAHPSSFIVSRAEYQLGSLYFNLNESNLSKRYLMSALSSSDTEVQAEAYTLLGELELNDKQYVSAKNYFLPVLTITNKNSDAGLRSMLGLGSALFFLGKNDEAISYLNEILSTAPDFERDRVNFYLAENYFAKGKYQEALEHYKGIDTNNPEIIKLSLYGSAYCSFNLGDYENAAIRFSEFTKTYKSDERIIDAKLRLADSYFGSKNYSAASRVYNELFSSKKMDDPNVYYQYAQALYKSGKTELAINEFSNLQKKFPQSNYADVSLYTIGWIKFQDGDYTESIDAYKNVLVVYPRSSLAPIIYYSIGDAFFNMGNYDSAIDNYREVLASYPSSDYVFDAVNGIQYSYVAKGEPEKAVDLIDRFVSQNPSLKFSDEIFFKKGEIYYSNRQYELAKESYKEFIERFGKSDLVPEAYYWIGKCADNLEQYEEAIYYFNTAFQNYPKSEIAASSILEIGTIYSTLEKYNDAVRTYNSALEQLKGSSSIPEILYMKGVAYLKADSLQQAYEVFTDVSYYYRETIFADQSKFEMGLIDIAAGRYENADKNLLQISEKRNDELGAKAQFYSGVSLFDQEKFSDAISALVRVRTVFSTYDEWLTKSYMLLGDCYVELNDKRKAEEMYRVVIGRHKNDAYGKEAREKIGQLE